VVDDDAFVLSSLRRLLSEYDVVCAANGRDALRAIADQNFDAVLCDLMMPQMTGMDLHEALAERPELQPRIIFMTGGAFTPAARAFLDRVPNERLDKPFDTNALRALVRRF